MIKSISFDQNEIIDSILRLHCATDIELDPTYSKGGFYKKRQPPKWKFDILPQTPDTIEASADDLPLGDSTVTTMIFDPPFLATTGKSLNGGSGNIINKRFGVFPNEKKLFEFYVNSLKEFHRILKPNGILIFKCQDKVSSGKQYLSHVFIINEAEKLGFYCKDVFILLSKARLVADWQKQQRHARKFHAYFLVFEKCSKKIEYLEQKCR